MLEIRKNTFSRNYENTFFREFSKKLYHKFKEKNINGVLLGSPLCTVDERLKIDALLLTPKVICIIDFKNFKGKITLPSEKEFDSGIWKNEKGERIKGGNSNSPYTQLKIQKRRFVNIYNKYIKHNIKKPEVFNPLHTIRIVCFQHGIELTGKIPSEEEINFFILDGINYLEKIIDIIDIDYDDVSLSENSFYNFKKIFRADIFNFDEKIFEDNIEEIESKSTAFDLEKLYEDQKEALNNIYKFVKDPELKIFILQGTTNSGKSHLIPYIQEIAYNTGIQEVELFAASGRVAKNLLSSSDFEKIHSIYSYIYGGQHTEEENIENTELNEDISEEEEEKYLNELILEKVPLKKSDNSDNALFIVDESHLVSDSLYYTEDLIFGSGQLLNDFIYFTDFKSTNRKIIFIGDPYQLHIGNSNESPLNPSYLEEHYELKTACYQLKDKESFSPITRESLKCVFGLRVNLFNSLRFNPNDNISVLKNEDFEDYVRKSIENNSDVHFLYFSNDEAYKTNLWIKYNILNNGDEISKDDIILFNNNISVENEKDPNARPIKIYNGQFARITNVSDTYTPDEIIHRDTKLYFRELEIKLEQSLNVVKIISFENYRINPKAELSNGEKITYKILLQKQIQNYIKAKTFENSSEYSNMVNSSEYNSILKEIIELRNKLNIGEKVKTKLESKEREKRKLVNKAKKKYRQKVEANLRKDTSSTYYKYKNAAHLKFGWAMTVHKSMSYKWDEIVFNVDPGENVGINNKNHFMWLYTGISRAKQKVYLINYKPLSPYINAKFIDNNNIQNQNRFFYISESNEQDLRLSELKKFILSKINTSSFKIENIHPYNWQERYTFRNKENQIVRVNIGYNNHGQFKKPVPMTANEESISEIMSFLNIKAEIQSFNLISDEWRKKEYEIIKPLLDKYRIKIEYIIQNDYKDKISLYSDNDELVIEIIYNGFGLFTSITAMYYSNVAIWDNFKGVIEELKK